MISSKTPTTKLKKVLVHQKRVMMSQKLTGREIMLVLFGLPGSEELSPSDALLEILSSPLTGKWDKCSFLEQGIPTCSPKLFWGVPVTDSSWSLIKSSNSSSFPKGVAEVDSKTRASSRAIPSPATKLPTLPLPFLQFLHKGPQSLGLIKSSFIEPTYWTETSMIGTYNF